MRKGEGKGREGGETYANSFLCQNGRVQKPHLKGVKAFNPSLYLSLHKLNHPAPLLLIVSSACWNQITTLPSQDHQNYVGRDSKLGPVIVSLKMEEDYQGSLARVLIRTQKETVYKIIPSSQLSAAKIEPEDYIKVSTE